MNRQFVSDEKWTYECPECGHVRYPCDFSGCPDEALYEGWYGSGLIRLMKACEEHAKLLRGYVNEEVNEKISELSEESPEA